MDKIAARRRAEPPYRHELASDEDYPTVGEAMSNAACDIAEALGAAAVLVPTYSGRTASAVARHRPRRPVIAVTHKRLRPSSLRSSGASSRRRSRSAGTLSTSGRDPRGRPLDRHRRARRSRRDHRGNGGQPPRNDEPDQGRDRLTTDSWGGSAARPANGGGPCLAGPDNGAGLPARSRLLGVAALVAIALASVSPLRAYFEAKSVVAARKAEVAEIERERARSSSGASPSRAPTSSSSGRRAASASCDPASASS